MARMLSLLFLIFMTGCTVSTGVYLEKDWKTDAVYLTPDLRTRWKLEATKEFTREEVFGRRLKTP